jgi:hypothetical protein
MRNAIPAQNRLFVKNQTTIAISTAGMSIRSRRMSSMIIMPIMIRTTSATMSNCGIDSRKLRNAQINARARFKNQFSSRNKEAAGK